jgi:hypothetical protein
MVASGGVVAMGAVAAVAVQGQPAC